MTRLLLLAIGLFVFFVAQCSEQFSNPSFLTKSKVTKDKVSPYDQSDCHVFCEIKNGPNFVAINLPKK